MRIILNPSRIMSSLNSVILAKLNLFLVNEIEGAQMTGKEELGEILDTLSELVSEGREL